MLDFLKQGNWDPQAILALICLVGLLLTGIVVTITVAWSHVRREEIRANLKRDMIDRGVPIDQIERLIGVSTSSGEPVNEKELEAQFASLLVQNEVPGPTMQRLLCAYQATDASTKAAVYSSLEEILGSEPNEEQLVAAVTALCPPRPGPVPTGPYAESPAAVSTAVPAQG
jgi:hypothetical protein